MKTAYLFSFDLEKGIYQGIQNGEQVYTYFSKKTITVLLYLADVEKAEETIKNTELVSYRDKVSNVTNLTYEQL
jgi:hypothetical protein